MTDTVLDDQHLQERLARMRQALDACPTEVPASLAIPARTGMDEVAKRLALGVDHTVVAFFGGDRKSTRLNSSHTMISYAVFCLKKKSLQDLEAAGKDIDMIEIGRASCRERV